jgi:hypothetical protein
LDTVVQTKANVIQRPTSGMAADADRKHSHPGGICCSIGYQSPDTFVESIDPFLFPDMMLMKVEMLKIELSKFKEKGLTGDLKKSKPQLQEQLCNVYIKDLPNKVLNHYKQHNGCVYDLHFKSDSKVVLHCTHYKIGVDGAWMNYKTCKKIMNNANNQFIKNNQHNCPGKMMIPIIDGNVGHPSFPHPFQVCGILTNIINIDLGQHDNHPTLK